MCEASSSTRHEVRRACRSRRERHAAGTRAACAARGAAGTAMRSRSYSSCQLSSSTAGTEGSRATRVPVRQSKTPRPWLETTSNRSDLRPNPTSVRPPTACVASRRHDDGGSRTGAARTRSSHPRLWPAAPGAPSHAPPTPAHARSAPIAGPARSTDSSEGEKAALQPASRAGAPGVVDVPAWWHEGPPLAMRERLLGALPGDTTDPGRSLT